MLHRHQQWPFTDYHCTSLPVSPHQHAAITHCPASTLKTFSLGQRQPALQLYLKEISLFYKNKELLSDCKSLLLNVIIQVS